MQWVRRCPLGCSTDFCTAGWIVIAYEPHGEDHRKDDAVVIRLMHSQDRRAFTLVELLVVVSIIALLISILLPSLSKARHQAKLVKCLSHARGMGQGVMVFSTDHNARMQLATAGPAMRRVDPGFRIFEYGNYRANNGDRELLAWPTALAQASGIKLANNWDWGVRAAPGAGGSINVPIGKIPDEFQVAQCPADTIKLSTPYYPRNADQVLGPGDPDPDAPPQNVTPNTSYWGRLSYAINEDVCGADLIQGNPSCWKDGHEGEEGNPLAGARLEGRLDRVYEPSSVALIIDAGPDEDGDRTGLANLLISAKAPGPELQHFLKEWKFRLPKKRHPKGALGVTFADGHGETVRPVGLVNVGSTRLPILVPAKYSSRVRISPYRPVDLTP